MQRICEPHINTSEIQIISLPKHTCGAKEEEEQAPAYV